MFSKDSNLLVHPAAWPFALPLLAGAGVGFWLQAWILAGVFLGLGIFCVAFFRNPVRRPARDGDLVISPADGKVTAIDTLENDENGYHTRISIFLSVFNVHINRLPMTGTVKGIHYHQGKFLNAMSDKSSAENEHNRIVMDTHKGQIQVVQIAGWIARRIVWWISEGEEIKAGQRFGLIRFGSRVDVYLPKGFVPEISMGQMTQGGKTILGSWQEED